MTHREESPHLTLAPDRPVWFGVIDGERVGIHYGHPRPDGTGQCEGWVTWGDRDTDWTLVSMEPLTLTPSLACRLCGDHGFIADGTWVPANPVPRAEPRPPDAA